MKQQHATHAVLLYAKIHCGKEFYQNSHYLAKGDCSKCKIQQCRDRER